MADSSNDADFEEHKKTYDGFINLTKWSIISLVVLLVILYFVVNP